MVHIGTIGSSKDQKTLVDISANTGSNAKYTHSKGADKRKKKLKGEKTGKKSHLNRGQGNLPCHRSLIRYNTSLPQKPMLVYIFLSGGAKK